MIHLIVKMCRTYMFIWLVSITLCLLYSAELNWQMTYNEIYNPVNK